MTLFHPIIGSISLRYNYYSAGLPVSIIDLNCTGSEDTILNCPKNALLGQHTCSSNYYAAGVACQSKTVIINTCITTDCLHNSTFCQLHKLYNWWD